MTLDSDNFANERALWAQGFTRIIGLDEVGRGCLAGPVVAAGVVFPPDVAISGITDSKKLDAQKRAELNLEIREKAIICVVSELSPEEVDRHNIYRASYLAMDSCIDQAQPSPDYVLVDGNVFPSRHVLPHTCLVKGDVRSVSIGAASIVAKVYRDSIMKALHDEFPWYGWDTNMGYATKKHYEGLSQKGFCEHHRKSFRLGTEKKLIL